MQPAVPPARTGSGSTRLALVMTAVALAAAVLALTWFVWYPTTLQPNVALTNVHFDATPCAPVLGGYANRFNATFTLDNSGTADGDAAVQFLLGNYSLGYRDYFVPKGAQVNGTGAIIWEVFTSPSDCGPLGIPGAPGVALASVTRSPEIDERAVVQAVAGPVSALGFMGLLVGILGVLARRHGLSLLQDLGTAGWSAGILTSFAAILLSNVVTSILVTPYNFPLDWTPALVFGTIFVAIAMAVFLRACRGVLREAARRRPPAK